MSRIAILGVVAAIVAAIAHADTTVDTFNFVLTATDTVPTSTQLNTAFQGLPGTTIDNLVGLSHGMTMQGSATPDVQIRAIQALSHYCQSSDTACVTTAHAALTSLIKTTYKGALSGKELLFLRAAIESIGPLQIPGDLDLPSDPNGPDLESFLNNNSRDIRAAAAHALRDLCNTNAISYLKQRYAIETVSGVKQVQLAISEALRVLPCPVN